MQSDILVQIELLLREQKFKVNIEKFIQFLRILKNNYVYPDAVRRFTKDEIIDIYEVLEFLAEKGFLEQRLLIYCPNCNRFTDNEYKTIYDLPSELYCPHDDYHITEVVKNAVVVYKEI